MKTGAKQTGSNTLTIFSALVDMPTETGCEGCSQIIDEKFEPEQGFTDFTDER